MNKHDFIEPGTRATVMHRKMYTGTVLSNTDPRAWEGSAAFYGKTADEITPEEISAHLDKCIELYEKATKRPYATAHAPQQPIMWDFGKVYRELVKDMLILP